jgi:tetratricopeptide (TPR) repeat protein
MTTPSGPPARGTAARRAQRAATSNASPSEKHSAKSSGNSSSAGTALSARSPRATRRQLDPDALAALEEERDFLLRSLSDLEREHEVGDVDDEDFEGLKDAYTSRAAIVLRAIADRNELITETRGARSVSRTVLTLVVVAVLAVGAGWVVFRNAGTRSPGQGLTGDARQDSANLILQAQSATGQASQALQAGDGVKALKYFESAITSYDKALELSPANAEALTYRGWVLHTIAVNSEAAQAAQLDTQARAYLDRAIAIDAAYSDARVFRAILERNAKQYAAAKIDLDAVDMNTIPPYMTNMIDSVRKDVESATS